MARRVQIDIQVYPFPSRRDLEFFIPADIAEVRADKRLGYVPLPKFVGFGVRPCIGLEIELLVRTDEKEIQIGRRPAGTDLGFVPRDGVPPRVILYKDRRNAAPKLGIRVRIGWGIARRALPSPLPARGERSDRS